MIQVGAYLAETKKAIANMTTAIEQGIITKTTKDHMEDFESQQGRIEYEISGWEASQPQKLTEDAVACLLPVYEKTR